MFQWENKRDCAMECVHIISIFFLCLARTVCFSEISLRCWCLRFMNRATFTRDQQPARPPAAWQIPLRHKSNWKHLLMQLTLKQNESHSAFTDNDRPPTQVVFWSRVSPVSLQNMETTPLDPITSNCSSAWNSDDRLVMDRAWKREMRWGVGRQQCLWSFMSNNK